MDLNMELIKAVREAQNATEKAASTYADTARRYRLTQEGAEQEGKRLAQEAHSVAEAAKARGFSAIDAKCAELDAQEQAAAVRRASDTAYWDRLQTKLRIFATIDTKEQSDAALKTFFAEFADDPIAIAAIDGALGDPMRGTNVLPKDTTGKRQRHLQEVVKASFERTVNKVGGGEVISPHDIATGVIFGRKSEIDAFCAYCTAQDGDFSKDDAVVWEEIRGKQAAQGGDVVSFGMRFKGVREH